MNTNTNLSTENNRGKMQINTTHPGTAAVLSLILPGIGQVFNGHFLWAIFWFIFTPGLWLGSGGTLGWVFHILSAVQAHRQAVRKGGA